MRRLRLLYPFLFAVLPLLNVLTRNPGGSTPRDFATLLAVVLLFWALVYALVGMVSRQGWTSPVVPLTVLAGIIWFYSYPAVRSLARIARRTPAPILLTLVVVLILAVATLAALRWLAGRPHYLERVTSFFALTGLLLVGWSSLRVVRDQIATRAAVRTSRLARELSRPIVPVRSSSHARAPRDIYLLILDEYANSNVLQERFGFDNHEFEDSLRQLGFIIPKVVRSNYVHTMLSLPSLLNFSHLTQLGSELGLRSSDPTLPDYLVENNRTAAFLKSHGYQFIFFPSQWWISTSHNRNADWEFHAWNGFNPAREATRSDLRRSFVGTTPLALLQRNDAYDADHVKRTLSAVARLPSRKTPAFVLAHVLNPHYPYVFDSGCHTLPARPNADWGRGREKAYIGQLRCLNRLLLKTVGGILQQHSDAAPIILLLGDHGTNSLGYQKAQSAAAVSPAQARERFGAFGAFFLPAGGAGQLTDSLTLVNLLPGVLNYYFGAGIQPAPDKLYMSLEGTPYLFVEVDPQSLSR